MAAQAERAQQIPGFNLKGDTLELWGPWRLISVQGIDPAPLRGPENRKIIIDGAKVDTIDTGSAGLLLAALKTHQIELRNFNEDAHHIFDLVLKSPREAIPLAERKHRILARIGQAVLIGLASLKVLLRYIGETVVSTLGLIFQPKSLRGKEFAAQLEQCSVNAVPVVSLVMLLIGIVVAYLFASQIEKYGANIFIVDGVSISICRELSPVIVAIIVAGRSGSAFTAQLGTMKLNEEIDAMITMGLSPMRVLIVPRFLALMVALPILVAIGDVVGIYGGHLIALYRLGIETSTFVDRLHEVLYIKNVWIGLIKAPVFAAFIAIIGCKMGLTVENNARSIGLHTTSTVVQSIVSVILLNAGFAVLLVQLGI